MGPFQEGNIPEAIRYFRKALLLSPGYVLAHYHLGMALHKEGKHREAAFHYYEALRYQPGNPEIMRLLDLARSGMMN